MEVLEIDGGYFLIENDRLYFWARPDTFYTEGTISTIYKVFDIPDSRNTGVDLVLYSIPRKGLIQYSPLSSNLTYVGDLKLHRGIKRNWRWL